MISTVYTEYVLRPTCNWCCKVSVFSLCMYLMAPIQLFTACGWGLWIRKSVRVLALHKAHYWPGIKRQKAWEEQMCILGTTKGTSLGTMKQTRTGRGQCVFHRKVCTPTTLSTYLLSMLENRMSALLHSSTDTVACINFPWNLFCCFDNKIVS